MNQTETWQLNASAMGPDEATQIGQRIVSEEPMVRPFVVVALLVPSSNPTTQAINLNLAISTKFQPPNVRLLVSFFLLICGLTCEPQVGENEFPRYSENRVSFSALLVVRPRQS